MAKVSIRKEDLDRVVQVAKRTAKRTNERVVVAHDRVELQDTTEGDTSFAGGGSDKATVSFD
jgi:hypothetical protein